MKGNMDNMMRQVQQMQSKMKAVQEELKNKEVEANAGGDMVTVTINGQQEIKKLRINPEVIDPDDIEMLQDLIIAAVNEAFKKANELASQEMNKITGGLNLPNIGNPF